MKKIWIPIFMSLIFVSCQKTWEQKYVEEAKELTMTCPRSIGEDIWLDSVVFNVESKTLIRYNRVTGEIDNEEEFLAKQNKLKEALLSEVRNSVESKTMIEHKANIRLIYISGSSGKTLLDCTFEPMDNGVYGIMEK